MKLDSARSCASWLAQETEIDVRDVHLAIEQQKIVLDGTVDDDGERQEIEALLARLPGVQRGRQPAARPHRLSATATMRYHVLAADYDGTLAHHGRVSALHDGGPAAAARVGPQAGAGHRPRS